MTFNESIKTCFRKYAVFNGRASRSEFWYWTLFLFFMQMLPPFMVGISLTHVMHGQAILVLLLLILIKVSLWLFSVAVTVRRLHDIDYSGWLCAPVFIIEVPYYLALIAGIPVPFNSNIAIFMIVYNIIFISLLASNGTVGDNSYGKDPLLKNKE